MVDKVDESVSLLVMVVEYVENVTVLEFGVKLIAEAVFDNSVVKVSEPGVVEIVGIMALVGKASLVELVDEEMLLADAWVVEALVEMLDSVELNKASVTVLVVLLELFSVVEDSVVGKLVELTVDSVVSWIEAEELGISVVEVVET